jgi:outer membrane protein
MAFVVVAALLGASAPARAAGTTLDTLNALASELQRLTNLINAYYGDMMRDWALLELNRRHVSFVQAILKETRDRFVAGELTRTDVAQAEASLALGRSQLHGAESQFIASKQRYIQAIEALPPDLQTRWAPLPVPPPVDAK